MSAPFIGITLERRYTALGIPHLEIGEAYARSLSAAGALPVLIPVGLPEADLDVLLPHLSGILLPGGGDVHPQFYGGESHPLVSGVDVDRDRVEIQLVRAAAGRGLPLLGICRGLQVINVALGGSLYADVLDQHPGALNHSYFPEHPRDYLAHPVHLEGGSRLAGILGAGPILVNSMHHQAVRQLAPGLSASAYAPDGLVEALELPGHPFALAVQWHPECLLEHRASKELFGAFLDAAGRKT